MKLDLVENSRRSSQGSQLWTLFWVILARFGNIDNQTQNAAAVVYNKVIKCFYWVSSLLVERILTL